jgi:membrane associated rhomboid family serine protease
MTFLERIKYNFQTQSTLTQIIVVNVAIYLTVNLIGNLSHLNLLLFTALPIGGSLFLFKFWTLFTYMFTHADFWHLFWNMILFYFMSQLFLNIMGQKKLLYLYVMSGICGGAIVLILGLIFPAQFGNAILIGASAAVLGVGATMAIYSPNYRVYLFGAFELPFKYVYLGIFVLNTLIDLSINTGGKISHVGGALFGLLYGYNLKNGIDIFNLSLFQKKKTKLKVVYNQEYSSKVNQTTNQNDDQRLNALLDKISKSGYDSLSKSEKDELFNLSQKK